MIPVFGRLSDKGRAAVHLAFLVALREEKREISSINFLTGIQCASPHLFAGTNLEKLGITPLDVSNLEKIQQEMQRLYMKAGIEHAAEKSDSTMGFSFPFSPTIKLAIETANKYAESSGAKSTGTAHLLFGILKADVDVAGRMERAGLEEARRCQAAILGIPAMDTVKEVKRASLPEDVALITATIPRERVVLAQTPQAFSTKLLKEAFARAQADGVNASDEAGLVERIGHDVYVVLGSERNIKITKPADMNLARFYLEQERSKS